MVELKNIQSLPAEARKLFLPFLQKLIGLIESEVLSAFVYGSATGKNFIPKVSDVNSVIVVKTVGPELLEKSLKAISSIRNRRIHAPLILTQAHIRSSLDVFPIEFIEMKDNYRILYGKDFLKDLVIEGRYIRLFCEQQIKGKLIRIRQGYLENNGKKGVVEILLKESLNTLIPIFRSLLRLKNIDSPLGKGAVLDKISETFGLSTAAMTLIWRDKKNDKRISGCDVHKVFGEHIQELEHLAEVVDRL